MLQHRKWRRNCLPAAAEETPDEPVHEEDDKGEFVYRVGALYEFEFGRYTFSPQVHYDCGTGKDAVVYMGAFGVAF